MHVIPRSYEVGFTWAGIHIWAGRLGGRAGMRSHHWIINGWHQAGRKSPVTFLNEVRESRLSKSSSGFQVTISQMSIDYISSQPF
jgi:hypothetical protein